MSQYSVTKFKGVSIHWGVGSTTFTGAGTFKLQSTDQSGNASVEVVADESGFDVTEVYYNFKETATIEVVITAAGTGAGDVTPTLAQPSDVITATDAKYTQIAGDWVVDSYTVRRANNGAMRVTYNVHRSAKI